MTVVRTREGLHIKSDEMFEAKCARVIRTLHRTPGLFRFTDSDIFSITKDRQAGIKVNMKECWDNPALLNEVASLMQSAVHDKVIHTVVGVESGGSPFATLIAGKIPARLRLIRKQETELKSVLAGSSDEIIGNVLVIDDVLGRGDSLIRTLSATNDAADEVTFLSVFSYGMEPKLEQSLGITVRSLFQVDQLVEMTEPPAERNAAAEQLNLYKTKIGSI
jgi:orotate phosphoribosyltransferase